MVYQNLKRTPYGESYNNYLYELMRYAVERFILPHDVYGSIRNFL